MPVMDIDGAVNRYITLIDFVVHVNLRSTTGQIFRIVWYSFRQDMLAHCQVIADGLW